MTSNVGADSGVSGIFGDSNTGDVFFPIPPNGDIRGFDVTKYQSHQSPPMPIPRHPHGNGAINGNVIGVNNDNILDVNTVGVSVLGTSFESNDYCGSSLASAGGHSAGGHSNVSAFFRPSERVREREENVKKREVELDEREREFDNITSLREAFAELKEKKKEWEDKRDS